MAKDKDDEMTKKNTKGYNQKYTDDTKENEAVRDAMTAPFKKIKKKVKAFSNRKTKEYQDSALDAMDAIENPEEGKKRNPIKEGTEILPKMGRAYVTGALNKIVNSKEERKAAGLKYKKGGAVHAMPDGTKMKGAKHGMKKGGSVTRGDGACTKGHTKGKMV